MKTSRNKLIVVVATSAFVLMVGDAFACGGGGGGRGGGFGVGFPGVVGGGYGRGGSYNNRVGQSCDITGGYSTNGDRYGQSYEPFHSSYFVQPGDTFHEVSLKEYGTSANARHIARFNRLASNAALVPGQRLMLPSISANGSLRQSRAPAPESVAKSSASTVRSGTSTAATSGGSVAASNVSNSTVAESLPKIAAGSTLQIDGQVLGEAQGTVRLRISGLVFPVEVVEWTTNVAKVRLPELELTETTKAEIEVLRSDGSLASKSGVELTPTGDRLALGN